MNNASYEKVQEILADYIHGELEEPDYLGRTKEVLLNSTSDGGAEALLWPSDARSQHRGNRKAFEHLDDEIADVLGKHGLKLQSLSGKIDVRRRIVAIEDN